MNGDLPYCLKQTAETLRKEPHWTECHVYLQFGVVAAFYFQMIILVILFATIAGWRCLKRVRKERERTYSEDVNTFS